jgi:peptide/nickel transport system substrate-binding protein
MPPFNNVAVRRALSYAIRRNRVAALLGGTDVVQPTCQVLPPNLPGYRRYCPYTIHRSENGKYSGPDLARARKLVAASGTNGQPVTVWSFRGVPFVHYLVSVLRNLGYNARSKVVKDQPEFAAALRDPRLKIQVDTLGWGADYPSTSNFFSPLFTCASINPGGLGELCNPRIDAEIRHAQTLRTSDPQAASHLWSKIDREIVDQAPVVAIANPRQLDFVSHHVGNYQYSQQTGTAHLDQLWVR